MKLTHFGQLLLPAIFLLACNQEQPPHILPKTNSAADNASPDEHGCNRKDGLQWSVVRNSCISTFEQGIHLEPVDSFTEKHLFAFLVFKSSEDDSQAEIFIPKQKDSFVFNKTQEDGAAVWKHKNMTLRLADGVFVLKEGDITVLYKGKYERR